MAMIQRIKQLGMRCGAYTVNKASRAQSLMTKGVDLIITDQLGFPHALST